MTSIAAWLKSFAQFVKELWVDSFAAVGKWSSTRKIGVSLAALGFIALLVFVKPPNIDGLREWADSAGWWFVVLFWIAYVVLTLFPIPRTIWTISAGILLGPLTGLVVAISAMTVSAVIALSIVRRLLGEWMRPRLNHPAIARISLRLEHRGWLAIASLRLVAGIPFSLLNYAAALTAIPIKQFAVATALGSLPTTAIGVFFGDLLTGQSHPGIVVAISVCALLGIGGLILDSRLPVTRDSQGKTVD